MKKICLLGATGSIGDSTFQLVKTNPEIFKIVGASAHSRFETLEEKAKEYNIPHLLDTRDPKAHFGEFLEQCQPDIVLNAVVGFAGLRFTIDTLKAKIPLALANKESLVAGGELVMKLAQKNNTPIIPVDSEHSALHQCLSREDGILKDFHKLYLTCSGGPFFGKKDLSTITKAQALDHPNWSMGPKITIDSATLANKCLEFFEAMHLFGATKEQIEIVIHRESIVHSMVEYADSSIIAKMSPPNMGLPIAYACYFPQRKNYHLPTLSFKDLTLTFAEPDKSVFKTLGILEHCAKEMGSLPIIFNATNEVLVEAFLNEKIEFSQIFDFLEMAFEKTKTEKIESIEQIYQIDKVAREEAIKKIQ